MDLTPLTLTGRTVRLEPLGLHHLDGLCAVGLEPSLWTLTQAVVRGRDVPDARPRLRDHGRAPGGAEDRVDQTRSRQAMLRIGATEEGVLRQHMIRPDGTSRDSVCFSVIDIEWPAVKARLEGMLRR